MTVTYGVRVAVLAGALLVMSGCAGVETEFLPPEVDKVEVVTPSFDGTLEPSAAVLALVPEDVETLTVTDYEQVRLQMGLPDLTTEDQRKDRKRSGRARTPSARCCRPGCPPDRAEAEAAVRAEPAGCRLGGAPLRRPRQETGFVLAFRDGTDMAAVGRARRRLRRAGGGDRRRARGLVTSGTTSDGDDSWAADESARGLAGCPHATYVSRGCVADRAPPTSRARVVLGPVRGHPRHRPAGRGPDGPLQPDAAGRGVPDFEDAYEGGVADPLTGRIGYVMSDPASAASLALDGSLPFAACAWPGAEARRTPWRRGR